MPGGSALGSFWVKQVYAAAGGDAAVVVGPELLAHQSPPCLQQMLLILITLYSLTMKNLLFFYFSSVSEIVCSQIPTLRSTYHPFPPTALWKHFRVWKSLE